ncbi:transposon TX1 [Tanacetum coccineum]
MRRETKRHYENREFYHGKSYGTNNINVNQKSSASFMFYNFPKAWGMGQQWMEFKKHGTVYDMYMVKKRLPYGQRYGFMRIKNIVNMESLFKEQRGGNAEDAKNEGMNGWEARYCSRRDDRKYSQVVQVADEKKQSSDDVRIIDVIEAEIDRDTLCRGIIGNQSVTVGKVMIHTISPDLIREVVHVKVKKRTYKVVVVEEINDVIEIDVDQKTSKEEEGGGENSFVAMEHGTFQDDSREDEDESDYGRRQTDNGNEDVDDNEVLNMEDEGANERSTESKFTFKVNEDSSSNEKKKSASKGFEDSKSQNKDMAADELSNIQMKDTTTDELMDSHAHDGKAHPCDTIKNSAQEENKGEAHFGPDNGITNLQGVIGDLLTHQENKNKNGNVINTGFEGVRVSEDALVESNKNHKEKEDDIISNQSDSIAKDRFNKNWKVSLGGTYERRSFDGGMSSSKDQSEGGGKTRAACLMSSGWRTYGVVGTSVMYKRKLMVDEVVCYWYGIIIFLRVNKQLEMKDSLQLLNLMNDGNESWCLFGDFNEVRCEDDRKNTQFQEKDANGFNEFINLARLVEIPMGGRRFTRISDDGLKFSKLDRFLVSEAFKNKWSNLAVIALDRKLSDHCPVLLKDIEIDFGLKPFWAFDVWLEEANINQVVSDAWNKECIENYMKKAIEWEMEVESRNLDDREVKEWLETRRAWMEKDREKCSMLKQKARVKWDIERDENSKFFHTMIKRRNNKNNIRGLMVDDYWCEDPENIKEEDEAKSLEAVIEEKEIRDAVWHYGSDKAPDPDDFIFKFILDGILIANETMKYLKRKKKRGLIFKVDFENANDSINWRFLIDIMRRKNELWGVRQGDPLFPFLSIITAEGFNAIVKEAVAKDRRKEAKVSEMCIWVDERRVGGIGRHFKLSHDCRDQWRWALNEDGKFAVKDLARLVDEIWLQTDRSGEETMWNNLAPKKVNIFVWRVLKGRLPVLNELDKRGIDLNTLLCPCCDENVETIDHSLLLCNMAWSVWVKIFEWWKGPCWVSCANFRDSSTSSVLSVYAKFDATSELQ